MIELIEIVETIHKGIKIIYNWYKSKKIITNKSGNPIFVLEIGRQIHKDVKKHLGEPYAIFSYSGNISSDKFHEICVIAYKKIEEILSSIEKELIIVLSGPIVMMFILGQLIGFTKTNFKIAYWKGSTYEIINPATREMLSWK